MTDLDLLSRVSAKLVKPNWAERVVSPAYDMLRASERDKLMQEDPFVFLHVTSSHTSKTGKDRTKLNKKALKRLLDAGVYSENQDPSLYLYRLFLSLIHI